MKTIEAVYEQGHLKPLYRLRLAEHQHVWLAILEAEPTVQQVAELAVRSPSFEFLADPAEDLYSVDDGQPV